MLNNDNSSNIMINNSEMWQYQTQFNLKATNTVQFESDKREANNKDSKHKTSKHKKSASKYKSH